MANGGAGLKTLNPDNVEQVQRAREFDEAKAAQSLAESEAIFRAPSFVGSRRHQAMNWSVQLHAGRGNADLLIRDAKMIMDWVWENHE